MEKPKKVKLSHAQRRALQDGVRHGNIRHSVKGRSAHGGFDGTWIVLRRNGWINGHDAVTEAGRAALQNS